MRTFLALVVSLVAAGALAQSAPRPRPPGTVPLEEPPPPPAVIESDPSLEPQVTIRKEGENTVSEYRIKGKLYMMKVTPSHGVAYYLIDNSGDGKWVRMDSKDAGLRVPMWVIGTF